jgi:flagellar hook-associated protein 3 FlgL
MQFGIESNLQAALGRVQRLQEQLSSGKQVSRPSDSPASTVSALRYRADIRRGEQLQRNIDDALGWMNTADRALTGGIEILNRVRSLTLQGINGASGPEARDALAEEIEQLRESALAIANTTYLGRPVFGGTTTGPTAYLADGTWAGDSGSVDRAVGPNVAVQVNVTGPDAFGAPGSDLFALFDEIVDHLTGDTSQLTADVEALDDAFTRLTNAVATIGSRTNQVEALRDRLHSSLIDAQSGLAEVESIDLPATIVKLQMQEVAYQAALGATSRMIQPSLVDFLR